MKNQIQVMMNPMMKVVNRQPMNLTEKLQKLREFIEYIQIQCHSRL